MDPNLSQQYMYNMIPQNAYDFNQVQAQSFQPIQPIQDHKEQSRDSYRDQKYSQNEQAHKKSRWDIAPSQPTQPIQPVQTGSYDYQSYGNQQNQYGYNNYNQQAQVPAQVSNQYYNNYQNQNQNGYSYGYNEGYKAQSQSYDSKSSYNNSNPNLNGGKYNKFQNNTSFNYTKNQFPQQGQNNKKDLGGNLKPVNWSQIKLEPFQKCFYEQTPRQLKKEPQEVEEYRILHEVQVKNSQGMRCPTPFMEFSSACLPEYIIHEIQNVGFKAPTPIQAQCWPILLKGCDLIGIAKTGSGKSLAYIIPALIHINAQPPVKRGESPIVVILAPTRELACQIEDECMKFGKTSNLNTVCCYGGVPKYDQVNKIKQGVDMLVACPGRLIDILEQGIVNLRRVTYLVLDEADRMLDMGFEPQIRKIISQIRPDRQTCMWSATWPKEIQQLGEEFLINPIHIQLGSNNEHQINLNITQIIEVIPDRYKDERLIKILSDIRADKSKIIIFAETKKGCENLYLKLKRDRYNVLSIHGDKNQQQRDYAISTFKSGQINILCATDVAARGLDVSDIKYVINYDMSKNIEDYVHRIGRTGRAQKQGVAYTFMSEDSERLVKKLIQFLQTGSAQIPFALSKLMDEAIKSNGRVSEKVYTQIYNDHRYEYADLVKNLRE